MVGKAYNAGIFNFGVAKYSGTRAMYWPLPTLILVYIEFVHHDCKGSVARRLSSFGSRNVINLLSR